MASDDIKFSHIVVHADDDDDIVIQTGVYPQRVEALPPKPAAGSDFADMPDEMQQNDAFKDVYSQEGPKASKTSKAVAGGSYKDDHYQKNNAEDLDVGPMSKMQKVIIALAFIAVFASIVYYMVFMR